MYLAESDFAGVGCGVVVAFKCEVGAELVRAFLDDAVDDDAVAVLAFVRDDVADVHVVRALRDDFDGARVGAEDGVHAVRRSEFCPDRVLDVEDDLVVVDFDLAVVEVFAGGGACDCFSGDAAIEVRWQFVAAVVGCGGEAVVDARVGLARCDAEEEGHEDDCDWFEFHYNPLDYLPLWGRSLKYFSEFSYLLVRTLIFIIKINNFNIIIFIINNI